LILGVVLGTFFMIVYKNTNGFTTGGNDNNGTVSTNGTVNGSGNVSGTANGDTGFQLPSVSNSNSLNTGNANGNGNTTNTVSPQNDLILNYFSNVGTSTATNTNTNTNTSPSTSYMLPQTLAKRHLLYEQH
jgi:hypothetical protein